MSTKVKGSGSKKKKGSERSPSSSRSAQKMSGAISTSSITSTISKEGRIGEGEAYLRSSTSQMRLNPHQQAIEDLARAITRDENVLEAHLRKIPNRDINSSGSNGINKDASPKSRELLIKYKNSCHKVSILEIELQNVRDMIASTRPKGPNPCSPQKTTNGVGAGSRQV